MRLETIEDVRNLRDSLRELYVTAKLSDIRLGSAIGDMSLNGREFKLSRRAVYQMCRMLGVPFRFARTLSERMPDIWRELSLRLTSQSHKQVTFKVDVNGAGVHADDDKDKIIGLFPTREDYISVQRFLGITEALYERISMTSGIESMVVDVDDESSSAFFYTPQGFSPVKTNGNGNGADLFRYGIGFSASSLEVYAPTVSESLLRLICSNMTYAPSHAGMVFKSRNSQRILNAVGSILREPERFLRYPEILSSLTEKRLSYREAEEAYSFVDKLKDNEGVRLVLDLERRIPLSRIARVYGYESLEAVPKSPSWKASAKTPLSAYETFNHLTEIGSRYTHIPEKDRLDVLIFAGHFMFKEHWDLEELAPQDVDFSDWNDRTTEAIQRVQ